MKRIIFAVIVVALTVFLLSLIPDRGNAQYPTPISQATPLTPGAEPEENFRVGALRCTYGFLTWYARPAHVNLEVDDIVIHGATVGQDFYYVTDLYTTVGDLEYFMAYFDPDVLDGHDWVVEGLVLVEGSVPVWGTWDHKHLDCTDVLIKSRVRFPVIFKKR